MLYSTHFFFRYKITILRLKTNLGKTQWFQRCFRTLKKRAVEQSSELDNIYDIWFKIKQSENKNMATLK